MDEGIEHLDEYYNCGYDGIYEPKEKAVIFKCVGRGIKLPPLSQIAFPPSIAKNYSQHSVNVRPSHHVLDLVAPAVTTQESDLSKDPANKTESFQNDQQNDIHSESSDVDVYISDQDEIEDECDSYPAKMDCPVQNTFETQFLPPNVICKTECSSSGNRLVLSEVDAAKNEKYDSATSDDEVFSNPSFGDVSGSDSEDIGVVTNNLNQTISCTIGKNSANNVNSTRDKKNIYLDENLSGSCQTSFTQPLPSSDDSNPSETVHLKEETNSSVGGRHESSSSNGSNDLIAEMFSSDENVGDYFANHFRTFNRNADVNLSISNPDEFPQLSTKQMQKPQTNKDKVESLPTSKLNIKSIAQLLLSNSSAEAGASEKSLNAESSKDLKSQNHGVMVIENLPQDYKKNNLDSFLQVFGKVESITLMPFYDKMTARVKMTGDLDWAVDCINDSNAFGAGEEPLRCYLA